MKKANENTDVIVGKCYAFSPEQLKKIATRMELAIKERCNPEDSIIVEAIPGVFFYHDPKIMRSDLEKRVVGISPKVTELQIQS